MNSLEYLAKKMPRPFKVALQPSWPKMLATGAALIILLITSPCINTSGLHQRTLKIQFAFNAGMITSRQVVAYRLYQGESIICEDDSITDQQLRCKVLIADGTRTFNIAAVFDDGSESLHSLPFAYTIRAAGERYLDGELRPGIVTTTEEI